jgi:multidrug efflux pump subunit AcrB
MDSLINEISFASNGAIIGTMLDGKKELPIRLKREQEAASDISQASLLSISSNNRAEYIENFSDIKLSRKLGAFSRYKGERENGVSAWTWPRSLPSVSEEFLREDINKFKESLPIGYKLEQAGEAAESAESNAQLFASAIVFFILILVGLVFALNSFRQTLLISSVAVLCLGLAILGLVVGMQNFGFIGLVGAIGLAGLEWCNSDSYQSHKAYCYNNSYDNWRIISSDSNKYFLPTISMGNVCWCYRSISYSFILYSYNVHDFKKNT